MHDFNCSNPGEMHYREMQDAARYYKEDPKGVKYMCQTFDDLRKETEMKKTVTIAEKMIEMGKNTLEDIAAVTDLPLEKIQELAGIKGA